MLLTEKLDRLSRESAKPVFSWMLRATKLGVIVATVDGDRRYDRTNMDIPAINEVNVKAQLANDELGRKATRLASAWATERGRLARGEDVVLTRRAPAWLTVEGTPARFVVVPERGEAVRRITSCSTWSPRQTTSHHLLTSRPPGTVSRGSSIKEIDE